MGKEKDNNAQFIFESLTPVEDNELGIYESALNYVFENPNIKNVALSGAYGAGKSSVLASYKKRTKDKNRKYIHISLAHFEDEDESGNTREIKESVLEGKILNQLIHQIPESNIPQTNFRVKSSAPQKTIIKYSFILSLLVLLLLHLTMSSTWENYINTFQSGRFKSFLSLSITPLAYLLSGVVAFGLIAFLLYQAVKLQKNRRILKKLNLQGNEIEIFEDSTDSYFDKYLNEVLYLFENAKADVIVFEDMDRFNANQVFERLREVNALINLRSNGRIIRFFYLLKDDIFTSKDRTKFFDFIIPIVPVVDGSNSYDQFIAHLQRNGLLTKFDERFLKGLSLYVDEMRLLKNICNELLIYYNRLNTTELDYNKMLALITYKNLFPRDFSDLQLGRGFVHALFEKKDNYISAEAKTLEKHIAETEATIEELNNEVLTSSEELSIVYNKRREPYSQLYYGYGNQKEIDRLNAEEQKRRQRVEDRNAGRVNELQEQVDQSKKALAALKAKPLHEIINRDNIESIFQTNETDEIGNVNQFLDVKSNSYFPLLKYLIRNGYIDESYSDYMTYFYENSLSRTDKIFLRSVTDRNAKGYDYELKEPQKVMEQLDEFDFDQEETLNYDLLDYLLERNPQSECVRHLVFQLREKRQFDFLTGYLHKSKKPVEFVHQCNLNWNALFKALLTEGILSAKDLNLFALYSLYGADASAINAINIENCLTRFISASTTFLGTEAPIIKPIIEGFKTLGISFETLIYNDSNKDLFESVYEESMYVISFGNIREVLMNIHGIKSEELIRHSNYSLLLRIEESPIYKYIASNMETYVGTYLEFCDGIISDDNDAAVILLNNSNVSLEHKLRYLEYLTTPLQDIMRIEDKSLWGSAIEYGAVIFTERNAIEYFIHSNKADHNLVKLINSASKPIDFTEAVNLYKEDLISKLFDAIIGCCELENEKYGQSAASLGFFYDSFDVDGLPVDKILILIDNNVIRMSATSLAFLRTKYPTIIPQYIAAHVNEYIDLIDENTFDYSETLQVISLDIDNDQKIRLLKNTNEPISILGKDYPEEICAYILENNLCSTDLPILFEQYESYSPVIRSIVFSYAKRKPEELCRCVSKASRKLTEDFFSCVEIPLETKISVLAALLPNIEKDDVVRYLNDLGLKEYVKIFDSYSKPKFSITESNEELLNAFRGKGWIFEYLEDPDREGFYKIRRRDPNKGSSAKQ